MFNKSGVVLAKDLSRYFISLQIGEFIGKPLKQLNAEHFDLSLLKQRMSFSEEPKGFGKNIPHFLTSNLKNPLLALLSFGFF